jgi:AraC-like DNA-binding protein
MAEARRRLPGTDERVDNIAERGGYADVTHFVTDQRRRDEARSVPLACRPSIR